MMQNWGAELYLGVSIISLSTQTVSLVQLLSGVKIPGLVRTCTCRVIASLLYVSIGILALVPNYNNNNKPYSLGIYVLFVFTGVQVMWQINSIADVKLKQRMKGRHRASGS